VQQYRLALRVEAFDVGCRVAQHEGSVGVVILNRGVDDLERGVVLRHNGGSILGSQPAQRHHGVDPEFLHPPE
jgi:hypothetical protein